MLDIYYVWSISEWWWRCITVAKIHTNCSFSIGKERAWLRWVHKRKSVGQALRVCAGEGWMIMIAQKLASEESNRSNVWRGVAGLPGWRVEEWCPGVWFPSAVQQMCKIYISKTTKIKCPASWIIECITFKSGVRVCIELTDWYGFVPMVKMLKKLLRCIVLLMHIVVSPAE